MTEAQKHPYKVEAQRTNRKLRQRMSSANPEQLLVRHEMWLQRAAVDEPSQTSPSHLPCIVLVHYLGDDAFQMLTVPPRPICVRPPVVCAPDVHGPSDTLSSSCSVSSVQLHLQCLPDVTVSAEGSEGEEMHEEDRVIDEENAAGEGQSAPSFDNVETPKPALSSSPRVQQPKLATSEPPILAQVVHVQTPMHALAPNGGLRERPAPLVRDSCFPGRMLLQAPLQASTRSASQNKLDDPSASACTTGVSSNGPEDEVCAQPSDADTSDAPVSPVSPTSSTGSEQLKSG